MNEKDWDQWNETRDHFAKYAHIKSQLIYGDSLCEIPDVSIVIPTYRRADTLQQAIDSVLNQKTQFTYEIVVVDNDGTMDVATDELMRQYTEHYDNILYYRNEDNIGMFGNWNRCIELSRTVWFCMLHDDDMLKDNYLEVMFPHTRGSKAGLIGSYREVLDDRVQKEKLSTLERAPLLAKMITLFQKIRNGKPICLTLKDALHTMFLSCSVMLTNRDIAIEIGGYDDIYCSADMPFWLNMMYYKHDVVFVPLELYRYRMGNNESNKESSKYNVLDITCQLVRQMCKLFHYSARKTRISCEKAAIISYNIFPGSKDILDVQKDIVEKYGYSKACNNLLIQKLIMLQYNARWGLMLFRK